MANGSDGGRPEMVVLKRGTSPSGDSWEIRHRLWGDEDCVDLYVNGGELSSGCGNEIPDGTEVAFSGGFKPGKGDFYLYGMTSDRVVSITAESSDGDVVVETEEPPAEVDRPDQRFFMLIREPVDNVQALVARDKHGKVVQRIELPGPLQ